MRINLTVDATPLSLIWQSLRESFPCQTLVKLYISFHFILLKESQVISSSEPAKSFSKRFIHQINRLKLYRTTSLRSQTPTCRCKTHKEHDLTKFPKNQEQQNLSPFSASPTPSRVASLHSHFGESKSISQRIDPRMG